MMDSARLSALSGQRQSTLSAYLTPGSALWFRPLWQAVRAT